MHYFVMASYDEGGTIQVLPPEPGASETWERLATGRARQDEGPSGDELAETLAESDLPPDFDGKLLIVPLDRAKLVHVRARPGVDVRSWEGNPF